MPASDRTMLGSYYAMDAPTAEWAGSRGEREILPDRYVRSISTFRCQ